MKFFLVVSLCLAPLVLCYDEKFDKIDLDKILADDKIFTAYVDCLLDKGPCDIEHSAEYRKILPEIIETACGKCSEIQKGLVRRSVKAVQERKPDKFIEIKTKYDPNGDHEKSFLKFVYE